MKTWATFPSRPLQSEPRSGVAGVVFEPRLRSSRGVAESSGFSLHAGLAAKASQKAAYTYYSPIKAVNSEVDYPYCMAIAVDLHAELTHFLQPGIEPSQEM